MIVWGIITWEGIGRSCTISYNVFFFFDFISVACITIATSLWHNMKKRHETFSIILFLASTNDRFNDLKTYG